MPYLESIRVFVRTVELGSITAGGRDLRLTPAVASNRVKELENRLGIRLINRTTRKLALTEAGRTYFDYACKVVEALDESEAVIGGISDTPKGAVKVTAPLGLGRRILAPLVPGFNDRFPEIELRLRLSDRKVDMMAENVDVAFVLGALQDSSMKMRSIAECPRLLCAAPSYVERFGMPATPADLIEGRHRCLLLRFPGSPEWNWTLMTDGVARRYNVAGPYDADEGDVLTDWALDGRGIVMKPAFEVAPHLASGTLVPVLVDHPPPPVRLACIYPHKRLQDPKVRLFVDYMVEECRERLREIQPATAL